MSATIQKATSRGQITLPAEWRKKFNSDYYLINLEEQLLKIRPINPQTLFEEEVIFNADRDNNGKGVLVNNFIKTIDSLDG